MRNIIPVTSYFSFPKKRRGKEKKGKREEKKRWEKRGFSSSLLKRFSFPLPFFGKEKYDVIGIMFLKNYTKSGKNSLCLKQVTEIILTLTFKYDLYIVAKNIRRVCDTEIF